MDRDLTLVPFGKGAVFVPAMTEPLDEPPVSVWQHGERVAEGTTGKRIVVLPGSYQVRLGSGAEEQRQQLPVEVRELTTTVVPVTWSGLAVHVVDEQLTSVRQSYEIIRVEGREYVGVGFGADEQAGEPVATWIVKPGLYKIVRVGESYRARRDYATVRLMPGELTHFNLVVDAETGDFQGGGEVPLEEVFQSHADGFWGRMVVGADGTLNKRENVVGSADGETYTLRGFVDAKMNAEILSNPLLLQLQIEEGQTRIPVGDWQKSQDRMDIDALYVYRLAPWVGPYLRGSGDTNLVPSYQRFELPTYVALKDAHGRPRQVHAGATRQPLARSFGVTSTKEGLGLNLRLFKASFGESSVRVGAGARQRITNGVFQEVDDQAQDVAAAAALGQSVETYARVPFSSQTGVECTWVATGRITRWVLFNLELDSLVPFEDRENVVLEAEGTVTVKLTSYVSLNYVGRFLRDRTLSAKDRKEQDLLLRLSFEIL